MEICNYCIKKGYSHAIPADLMGIRRATISKIENGKFAISVDYLFDRFTSPTQVKEFVITAGISPKLNRLKKTHLEASYY